MKWLASLVKISDWIIKTCPFPNVCGLSSWLFKNPANTSSHLIKMQTSLHAPISKKRQTECTKKAFAFSILNRMYHVSVIRFPSSSFFSLTFNFAYFILKFGCNMDLWKNKENWNKVSDSGLALAFFSEVELWKALTRPARQLLQEVLHDLHANVWLPHGLKTARLSIWSIEDTVVWKIALKEWVLLVVIWKTA